MVHFLIDSFSLLAQRKRIKRKGNHSLGPINGTSLCCSQRADASESRPPLRGTPPNRFPALCCAARLREMLKTDKRKPTFSKSLIQNNKGFTLLEILLAFFIFSIIFVTIYASYSGSFRTINLTESRMEIYRKAAIALERISEDLQASYISNLPPNSYGEPTKYTQFLGQDTDINGKDADTMSFFSRIPPLFSDEVKRATGQLISYNVIEGSGEEELVLLRSESPEFIDESDERGGMNLCDGLQAITFTYFDADGEPHENWDSDSEEFEGALPIMVSVSFEFLNAENPDAPLTFMTSITLPANYVPGPLQFDVPDDTGDDGEDGGEDDASDNTSQVSG